MALDSLPVEHLFTLVAVYGVELPGLDAWVSCRPLRPAVRGGDLYYFSVCSRGSIARVTIADVAGGDWVTRRADGTLKLDVRLVLTTDDGASIFMTYSGFAVPAADGTMTVRVAPQFETGDERYAWLNNVQAVAHGTTGATNVTYDVYRLL